MDRKTRRAKEAQAIAAHIEEQAKHDDWTRVLYAVQPSPEPVRLQIGRQRA